MDLTTGTRQGAQRRLGGVGKRRAYPAADRAVSGLGSRQLDQATIIDTQSNAKGPKELAWPNLPFPSRFSVLLGSRAGLLSLTPSGKLRQLVSKEFGWHFLPLRL